MKNHLQIARRLMPLGAWLALLLAPTLASAQALTNYVWSNTNGGAWSDLLSWNILPGAPVSASNTVLSFSSSGSTSYTATNDLAAPFQLNRLVFTNTSSNGAITLTGGALQFQASGTNTPQLLLNSNGTAFIANDLLFDTHVTVGGAGGGLLTLAGGISGLGGLSKTGTNTLVLAGSNSFSGPLTISNGIVSAQNSFALGTSNIAVISGAALELTNSLSVANPLLTLNGTGVANTGALRSRGDTNTFAGSLLLATSSRINSDAGLLVLNSTNAITGNGVTLSIGGTGNTLISSPIALTTGGVTKDGTGTLTLSGTNSSEGATVVNNGTLMLAASDLLNDAGAVTINGGTLNLGAQSDAVGVVTLQSGSIAGTTGTLTGAVFNVQAGAVSAQLGGSGGLFKSGAGTVTLSGSNSYSGATVISNGVLSITHSAALGSTAAGVVVSNGAALELTNNVAVGAEALTLAGGGVNNAGALRSRGGTNFLSGDLLILTNSRINTDAGLLVLDSANPITGAGFTLSVGGASNTLIARPIATGTGGLIKDGAGTLTLTASNSFTGAVTVSNGVLAIAQHFALGSPAGGVTVVSNAAMELTNNISVGSEAITLNGFGVGNAGALRNRGGTNTYAGAITLGAPVRIASDAGRLILDSSNAILGAGQVLTIGGAGDVLINSVINTGSGSITKTNGGTLTLTATNLYTGGTVLNGGVVAVLRDAALGTAAGTLSFGGGTLRALTNITSARAITLNTGGGTFDSGGFDSTLSGVISGGNNFTKVGAGTLTLSGNNTYGAAARTNFINGGTLSVNASARLGSTAGGIAINSNAVLRFTGSTVQTRVLTVGTNSGGGGIEVTGSNLVTQTGTLTGGTFTKLGTGYLIVTNNNTGRNGTNIVAGGVLQNDSLSALGGGPFLLQPGGTFSSGSIGNLTNNITLAGGTLGGTLGVLGAGGSNRLFSGNINVIADSFISTRDQRTPGTNIDLFIRGLVSGGGNLTVTGGNSPAQIFLTNANTFSGNLTIGSNVVLLATHTNGSGIGTANVVLTEASMLSYRIGGTNRLIVTDTNGVTTTNATADANTNFVRVNSIAVTGGMGNLDVRRPGVNIAAVANNRITFNALGITNGTLLATGSNGYTIAFSGPATLSGAVAISVSNSTTLSLDGALGESTPGSSLLKIGTGTLLLTNIQESTYSGGTVLNAGAITAVAGTNTNTAVFVTNVLGTGPITLNGGTLNLRSDTNQTIGPGAGYNVTAVSNVVINVDRFTANGGAGRILTLNSLTLGTNLFGVSAGNTYQLRFVGPATLTGNTLFSNSGSLIIDQPLNDGGGGFRVIKLNSGTLFLTNRQVQQFSGPLDIRGGTVRVDAGTNNVAGLFGAQPVVILGGGALELRTDGFSTAFTTTNGTMLSLLVTNNGQSILRVARAVAVGSTDRIITINNLTLTNNSIFRTENADNYDIRIVGTTMLGTNSQFDVANSRNNNPFSLELAGPIVDTPGFASPLRKFNSGNILGYSGTNNPAFSGGTFNISGPIQWRTASLPAGSYQFGSGPITLDGAASFGFLNNVTSNYTFLNKFIINGSVAASGNPLTSGGGTIDATSQGGSPQVFFAGPVDLRGNLTVTAGAAGAYGTNLFAATFTGPFNVFGDNRRIFIGGGGAGTGARLIFSNSLVDDGTFRTTWFVGNNNTSAEFAGTNSGFNGNIRVASAMQGNTGRIFFRTPSALPGGQVIVDHNAYAGVRFDPAAFGVTNLFNKFQFAPDAILGIETNSAASFDLGTNGLNTDVRLGVASGFSSILSGLITPNGNVYKIGGGGGTMTINRPDAFSDNGLTPRSLSLNPNPFAAPIAPVTAGTIVLLTSNSYTGGTIINGGTVNFSVGRSNTAFGTGRIDTYGLLTALTNGTFADLAGLANNNPVVTHAGSEVRLDNANATNNNRWGDAVNVDLNASIFRLIGRNLAGAAASESVADIVINGGSQVTISGSATAGALATTLTASNLVRVGNATLYLNRSTGTGLEFGNSNRFALLNAPPVSNNIVAPFIINATDNTFVNYVANGFTNATYTSTNAAAAGPNDVLDISGLPVLLGADTSVHALRSSQPIGAGASSNLNVVSGGVLFSASATHSNLSLSFGPGGTGEGLVFTGNGATVRFTNSTLTAGGGLTKFGEGTLRLETSMPAYSNGWNINRGTLIVGSTAAGALGTSDAANAVRLNGGATLQLSTTGNANYTGGKIFSTDNNTLTLDYGGNTDRVQTYAGGLDFNAYGDGPLGSTLAVRLSGSRDRFNVLGPVTLNSHVQLNVANSTFISGGTNRFVLTGGLTGTNRTLTKFGNAALVLTADNSATFTGGAIRVLAGTLGVEHNGALGDATSSATIAEGAVLEVGYGVTNFAPLAAVTQDGGSAERWLHRFARFSGATNTQTYVVPTNVNLQFVGNLTGLTNKTIRLNGGSIEAYNFTDATNGTQLGNGVTIELGADSKIGTSGVDLGRAGIIFTNNAPITETGGPRSLTKIGLDTVILTTNSTYTGNTTVQQGILRLGTNDALTSVGILSVTNQGVFDLASFNQSFAGLAGNGFITNSVTTNQPGLRIAVNVSNLFRGDLGGRFDLIKTGDGDLTLAGAGSGTGSRQIYSGTLYLGANSIGNSGPLGGPGASVLLFDSLTSANLFTLGPFNVPQQITVDNNFSGGTKTIGGLTAGTSTFSGSLLLLDNVYINAAAGGRVDYTGNIIESTPVGITKVGAGVLNLTGNNNYSGQTTVAEGTLLVNSTAGSGTGGSFVYLGTGTTLGGSGRIGGSVQIDYGAFFKPGNSAGGMRIDGNLSLAPTAAMTYEIGGLIPTNEFDCVSVGGAATIDGSIELRLVNGYCPTTNATWNIMEFASRTGSYANAPGGTRLATTDNLGSFRVSYGATNVVLDAFRYTDTGTDGIFDAWALKYFGVTNMAPGKFPSQRDGDFDGDGQSNYAEFLAGTIPTNRVSFFRVTTVALAGTANIAVRWTGADETTFRTPAYEIQYTTDFLAWQTVANPALNSVAPGEWEWVDDGSQTSGFAPLTLPTTRNYRVRVK